MYWLTTRSCSASLMLIFAQCSCLRFPLKANRKLFTLKPSVYKSVSVLNPDHLQPSAGAGAAESGVDTTPHLHRGHFQHHRGARHRHMERDPPQDWDDVQRLRPRLPRPQLPGQCALRTSITGRDGGLPETGHYKPSGSWFSHVNRTVPSTVDLIKLDENGKLELRCWLDVYECG